MSPATLCKFLECYVEINAVKDKIGLQNSLNTAGPTGFKAIFSSR